MQDEREVTRFGNKNEGAVRLAAVERRRREVKRVDWRTLIRPRASLEMLVPEVTAARLDERRTLGRKTRDLQSWLNEVEVTFAGVKMSELGVSEIIAWLSALQLEGQAPKTIWKKRSFLSADFQYAIRVGAVDDNPVHRLPTGIIPDNCALDPLRGAIEILAIEILRRMITDERIPFCRRILWAIVLLTGARFGEAASLCYGDWNPNMEPFGELVISRSWDCREHVLSPFPKAQRIRRVPVHPRLAKMFREARRWFTEVAGHRPGRESLIAPFPSPRRGLDFWHENTAIRWWRKDLVTIGAPAIHGAERTLHSARDTFVSLAVNGGAERRVVESLTHTADPKRKAFDGYVHYLWPTLCDAVSRIEL